MRDVYEFDWCVILAEKSHHLFRNHSQQPFGLMTHIAPCACRTVEDMYCLFCLPDLMTSSWTDRDNCCRLVAVWLIHVRQIGDTQGSQETATVTFVVMQKQIAVAGLLYPRAQWVKGQLLRNVGYCPTIIPLYEYEQLMSARQLEGKVHFCGLPGYIWTGHFLT